MKYVPKDTINYNPSLVQITVWHQKGGKQLSETIMDYITDAFMHHSASMS